MISRRRSDLALLALGAAALGAAGCGGRAGRHAAEAPEAAGCAGFPFAMAAAGAPTFWAARPGVYEAEPTPPDLPAGHLEARDAARNLWLGSLRRRGGEVHVLEAGAPRSCRALRLESEGVDRGWLVLGPTGPEAEGLEEALRYSFTSTVTGLVSAEAPERSRTIEEVSLELAGPFLRRRSPGGAGRVRAAGGCTARLHVVDADDDRIVLVSAPGSGPVRTYATDAALTLFLDRRGCLAALGRAAPGTASRR